MLQSYPVFFGSGYRSSMNETYKEAKANYGIVTSLPFDGKAAYEKLSAEEQLAYFMKNKTNRERFEHEIKDLLRRKPQLLPRYHQIMGKIQATQYKKKLKTLGLKKGHFAILEGVLISGAPTREDIDAIISVLVPEKKTDWVHVFKL